MATRYIAKYGSPTYPGAIDLYQKLALQVLKNPEASSEDFLNLRDMLFQVITNSGKKPQSEILEQLAYFMQISHVLCLRTHCSSKKELSLFAAKQAISLLRYTSVLPAIKTFFDAGQAAKVRFM